MKGIHGCKSSSSSIRHQVFQGPVPSWPSASLWSGKRHRFPPQIIAHAVWLYYRFPLSLRLVEEMLLERGILVSYEIIRRWGIKFGPDYARRLHRNQTILMWLSSRSMARRLCAKGDGHRHKPHPPPGAASAAKTAGVNRKVLRPMALAAANSRFG